MHPWAIVRVGLQKPCCCHQEPLTGQEPMVTVSPHSGLWLMPASPSPLLSAPYPPHGPSWSHCLHMSLICVHDKCDCQRAAPGAAVPNLSGLMGHQLVTTDLEDNLAVPSQWPISLTGDYIHKHPHRSAPSAGIRGCPTALFVIEKKKKAEMA